MDGSGMPLNDGYNGVQLTQEALSVHIGGAGRTCVAIAIFFFAFSSIFGNYYYGEANIMFITPMPPTISEIQLTAAMNRVKTVITVSSKSTKLARLVTVYTSRS